MSDTAPAINRPLRFRVATTAELRGPSAWISGVVRAALDTGVSPWWLIIIDDAAGEVVVGEKFDGLFAPRTDPLSDAIRERDRLMALAQELTWDDWKDQCAFAPKLPQSPLMYEWIDGEVQRVAPQEPR